MTDDQKKYLEKIKKLLNLAKSPNPNEAAAPYASHQRGLNENFNGLLRQYIPKGTDLRVVSDKDIKNIETALNNRPRKCLNYMQPSTVFKQQIMTLN